VKVDRSFGEPCFTQNDSRAWSRVGIVSRQPDGRLEAIADGLY
jgi:hypothetical protein